MIKRSPSRNTRSKSIKVKHILQICLLLGVCFWLIYQVKHSHDKKKEFDEKGAKVSVRDKIGDEILKLGRKDLHPRVDELNKNDKHDEDEEEEPGLDEEVIKLEERKREQEEEDEWAKREEEEQEEDRSKHEEEEQEEDRSKHEEEEMEAENKQEEEEQGEETKNEETEDVVKGAGDDEIDEGDQEKIEGEIDHDEDTIDEEKEREEEGDEKETESNEADDKGTLVDHEASLEDQDHDEGAQSAHEAREENYKADDASSAVTHDTQSVSTELEKLSVEMSHENSSINDLEQENKSNDNKTEGFNGDHSNAESQLIKDGVAENDPSNATADFRKVGMAIHLNTDEKKDDEHSVTNPEDKPLNTATYTSPPSDLPKESNQSTVVSLEVNNNPTGGNTDISGPSMQNESVIISDSALDQNKTIDEATTGGAEPHLETVVSAKVTDNSVSDGVQADTSSNTANNKAEFAGTNGGNSSHSSVSDASDEIMKPELTVEPEVNSGLSSTTKDITNHYDENGNNNESGQADESSISGTNGLRTIAVNDPIDSSDASRAKDKIGIQRDDLREIKKINSEDAAAE